MNKELQKAVKMAKREYYRKYRKNNPEKYKQYQKTYWEKKAREILEKQDQDIKKA